MTDDKIKKAIGFIKRDFKNPNVAQVDGFVVIFTNGRDLDAKTAKIKSGKTSGFMTVERAINRMEAENG